MDLVETLKTNLKIKGLIRSKYELEADLLNGTGPEARYYRLLKGDAEKLQSALGNEGIAEKIDTPAG